MKKVLLINGPNLNMLGKREKELYGEITLSELDLLVITEGEKLGLEVKTFQSNHEGEIIDKIHNACGKFECIIINPGAYSHYSIALRDSIASVAIPTIEVHITNIYAREDFRRESVIAPVCRGQINGFGVQGYVMALMAISKSNLGWEE